MDLPLLVFRGKGEHSLILSEWNPEVQFSEEKMTARSLHAPPNKPCRAMKFSNKGFMFVYCDSEKTYVYNTVTLKELATLPLAKTCGLNFSPDDKILCTLEPFFTSKELPEGKKNLKIWDTSTWDCLAEIKQKSQSLWSPVWFGDASVCARLMTNNIFFYAGNNFNDVVTKLHIDKLENFSLSPTTTSPHRVACFVRGAKGAPSSVKIFNYPKFERDDVIASKSFFKADTVKITWNQKGTAILIRAATEVDTTGASYYGEQSLHYMSCNGDTSIVQLPKNGPIYDVAWDPDSTRFCVTYGFMPAKASIFNHKCNILHDFGPSPKNMCVYNPQGNILLLAGFGNLRGNIEVWHNDSKGIKQIGQLEAPDTTQLEWCPDGVHFITATTTPRLRVNNGYKIWNYSRSAPLVEKKWENELHEVLWQNFPEGSFKMPVIKIGGVSAPKVGLNASKPQSYVPPHARGRSDYDASKFKQDEEEIAQAEQNLSKSALKNKKKREAKKKKEQQVQQPASNLSSSQRDAVAMAKYLLSNSDDKKGQQAKTTAPPGGEIEKKIKNLRKKIQTIEKLKVQQIEGKQLEKNQIEKIATESDLRAQLRELELG
uniref:eukaryotic translation initiation factor 2A-like n=1 Tax=Styela clava TaxID=7725 RepID=UPI00193A0F3B|nr:eukaryotic translation initiation factor 2A-like [Styela clava]